tara:strand:- start:30 stop:662 length:633 start_codon:yes stop_codon:yes gene_type:complete
MPTHKDSQNITKRIYLSEENFEKLKRLGVGSSNDKLSTLLDKHEQILIDQSKPSAATSKEPLTDYFIGLIIWYYHSQDKDPIPLDENTVGLEESNRSRKSLRNNIEKVTKENGWHLEYPTFFTDMRNNKGRFQKKLDKCLELLVRHKILERINNGYKLIVSIALQTEKKLNALRYQTVTNAPPTIYYKTNQKRKTFKDGSPVPSIDLYLG